MKAKDKILETANKLFYENGIRAVGVDTIVSEACVAKATLYKHFPSKNDLIVGYIESMSDMYINSIDKNNITILSYFKDFAEQMENGTLCHCPFVGLVSEFPKEDHKTRKSLDNHKEKVFELFKFLAEKENLREPETVANQLILIRNGATICRQMEGKSYSTKPMIELVELILENYKKK